MKKLALALMLISTTSHAQTFVCGSIDCPINGNTGNSSLLPTGIDGVVVDGTTYNVAFTATQVTTFNEQTGIDAATAIANFMSSQTIPNPVTDTTNGIYYMFNGKPQYGYALQTALFANGTSDQTLVFLDTYPGQITGQFNPFPWFNTQCGGTICTTWTAATPASAPELDPASLASALTLLCGVIAVRRRG